MSLVIRTLIFQDELACRTLVGVKRAGFDPDSSLEFAGPKPGLLGEEAKIPENVFVRDALSTVE
jgi:hypothetical protein